MTQGRGKTPTVQELLKWQQEKSKLEYELKQLKQHVNEALEARREWFIVTYQGYDADHRLHRVAKRDGSIISAKAQFMPESIGIGSTLIAFCPSESSFARLLMPL